MWMREIHRKFVLGIYSNEYEFAFDMLLSFGQHSYIAPSSELVTWFGVLFCEWVLNVHDVSITDMAKGPWDSWDYLRYFDGDSSTDNVCRMTGEKLPKDELDTCVICENQYKKSLGMINETLKCCKRCP